jgi:hypothetical protein
MRGVKSKDAPYESAPSQAALDMTAGAKLKKLKSVPKPKIIYLSKKTKEPVKRVRKGQEVYYALQKPDGVTHILHSDPQAPNVKLKKYLKKHIGDGKGDFALFSQRRRTVAKKGEVKMKKGWKVVDGSIVRWSKDKGRYIHVKRTALAVPTVKREQQPVLYRSGQKRKAIRPGFFKRGRDEISQLLSPVVVPLGKTVTLNLKGKTIHDSIRGLVIGNAVKGLQKWQSVYYQFVVKYRDPKRPNEVLTVPGAGASHPPALRIKDGRFEGNVGRTAALTQVLSTSIRFAFTSQGLRFTELAWLNDELEGLEAEYKVASQMADEEKAERIVGQMQKLSHADYGSRLPGRGPETKTFTSIFPENAKGKRLRPPYADTVAVQVKFEIVDNEALKVKTLQERAERKAERKHKKK